MNPLVEEFGKVLTERVRDVAIEGTEVLRNPFAGAYKLKGFGFLDRKTVNDVLDLLMPDLVDAALFHLLHAIDSGDLKLIYVSSDGRSCDLEEEGMREMAGWLNGEDGWVSRFSRFKDGGAPAA